MSIMAKSGKPAQAGSDAAQAKRKQFSRNKKKNWRKFLNTKEIDAANEEKLKDELSGGAVSGKANEDLFFVDTKPDEKVKPTVSVKRSKEPKLLHCQKALLPHPHTKPVEGQHKAPRKRPAPAQKYQAPPSLPAAVANGKKASKKNAPFIATVDIWASAADGESSAPKPPATRKAKAENAKVSAVHAPHPGQSYNPAYEDHVDAINMVGGKLAKEESQEKFWAEKVGATVQQINSYATYADEMRLDQPGAQSDDESESDSKSEAEETSRRGGGVVRAEDRKTKAQRNKERRLAEERRRAEEERLAKQRENEVYSLRSLKRKLEAEQDEKEAQIVAKKEKLASSATPKKLSKYKFEEAPMEVQLPEELSGTLRQLKPEGNLLKDRFKSIQERNVVEVRQKIKLQRRYKLKEYEKRSFKSNPWN